MSGAASEAAATGERVAIILDRMERTLLDAIKLEKAIAERNASVMTALRELVEAIDNNSGYEPSKSVYDMALDAARAAIRNSTPEAS